MDSESGAEDFISRYKIPLALGLVGIVLLIGGLISSGVISKTFVKSTKSFQGTVAPKLTTLAVDVSGAVLSPGVYSLPSGSRIEDAIKAAGGVTEEVDTQYLAKSINLAQKVSDGTKIYIPFSGEGGVSSGGSVAGASSGQEPVNINNAGLDVLDKLPGVGPVTAQKIIDNRPYSGIEELLTKKSVSRSVYEKIKMLVSTY